MQSDPDERAVIYCRVSSAKQTTKGDGLGSQETRCREYAKYKGYQVAEVFRDDVTGGVAGRPGMRAMLYFLRQERKRAQHVVIIDDISRLARGLEAHLKLRSDINAAGGRLESPSIEFGEDSDSVLVENLLASVSQHQRQKNAEQTRNRMRARASNGYWVFQAPVGYRYGREDGHGKILVRNEPLATVIAEALNGYATGRFQSQAEVKRFLESFHDYPRDRYGEVRNQRVNELLTRVIYAGYIDLPDWGIHMLRAKHQPLINFETFQAIKDRLSGAARVPARKDLNLDFPLRGFVTCGDCGRPLSACWSKGRHKKYPYYLCATTNCPSHRKSVRKERLEQDFEEILRSLRPSRDLFGIALTAFREIWDMRRESSEALAQSATTALGGIDSKIAQLTDRIIEADNRALITVYESRIQTLAEQKAELSEKITNCGRALPEFEENFRTAFAFLGNPYKVWTSERLEDKLAVLKLVFLERLPYDRKSGFRTAETTLPFKALEYISEGESKMARPRGFEPLTFGSGGRRSIH